MRAFLVDKGTEIKVIPEGKEWYLRNFTKFETTKDNMFFVEELVVDPTGISKSACVPGCVTIGSHWASKGWFGFRRDGWYALIPSNKIRMDCE